MCALLYALLFSVLPAEQAWRALFLVGLAPALLVVAIRRYVKEPDVYEKEKAKVADAPRLTEIFAPKLITTTLRAALLTTGAQGGYYAITTWLPTFLKTERHHGDGHRRLSRDDHLRLVGRLPDERVPDRPRAASRTSSCSRSARW